MQSYGSPERFLCQQAFVRQVCHRSFVPECLTKILIEQEYSFTTTEEREIVRDVKERETMLHCLGRRH